MTPNLEDSRRGASRGRRALRIRPDRVERGRVNAVGLGKPIWVVFGAHADAISCQQLLCGKSPCAATGLVAEKQGGSRGES